MPKIHFRVIIILIFLPNVILLSQLKNTTEYPLAYSVSNDTIEVAVSVDKIILKNTDTLTINFGVTNISPYTVGLFLKPIYEFLYSEDSTLFRIIVNYVYNYTPDFEMDMNFYTLKNHEKKSFIFQLLPGKYSHKTTDFIQIGFWVSYVPNVEVLNYKIIDNNIINANNFEVLNYLKDFTGSALNIKVIK